MSSTSMTGSDEPQTYADYKAMKAATEIAGRVAMRTTGADAEMTKCWIRHCRVCIKVSKPTPVDEAQDYAWGSVCG